MDFRRIIAPKLAGRIMLAGLSLLALFHVLVMLNLLPSNMVWGGRAADSDSDLIVMEAVALIVTLLIMAAVAFRMSSFESGRFRIISAIAMWAAFALFVFSTVGNLTSNVPAEKFVFTPISVILALLALRLAARE